jgi:hypothetical protein
MEQTLQETDIYDPVYVTELCQLLRSQLINEKDVELLVSLISIIGYDLHKVNRLQDICDDPQFIKLYSVFLDARENPWNAVISCLREPGKYKLCSNMKLDVALPTGDEIPFGKYLELILKMMLIRWIFFVDAYSDGQMLPYEDPRFVALDQLTLDDLHRLSIPELITLAAEGLVYLPSGQAIIMPQIFISISGVPGSEAFVLGPRLSFYPSPNLDDYVSNVIGLAGNEISISRFPMHTSYPIALLARNTLSSQQYQEMERLLGSAFGIYEPIDPTTVARIEPNTSSQFIDFVQSEPFKESILNRLKAMYESFIAQSEQFQVDIEDLWAPEAFPYDWFVQIAPQEPMKFYVYGIPKQ